MKRIHTITLIIYGMIGMVMAASSVPESLISVSRYRMSVLWFLPETTKARLDALLADGHIGLFELYQNMQALSLTLVTASIFFGLLWGIRDKSDSRLLKIKPIMTLIAALFVLYALNALLQRSLDDLVLSGVVIELGLSAMPIYWLVGLVFSAAFTGHYAALGAHDSAVLFRIKFMDQQKT